MIDANKKRKNRTLGCGVKYILGSSFFSTNLKLIIIKSAKL